MIPIQNLVIFASVIFYLVVKIVCLFNMYKRGVLSSIPELDAEEDSVRKWVPKKKHEVLKAKYKCLKKLFQIYDASVIGILPEQMSDPPGSEVDSGDHNRRRKRSHRTKTDACAGTNETTSGDNNSEFGGSSVATAIIRELAIDQSCISTQMDHKIDKFAETIETYASEKNFEPNCQNNCQSHCQNNCQSHCQRNCHSCNQKDRLFKENQLINLNHQIPYVGFERKKLTRFQCFVQRLFGIRKEAYKPEEQMYAASDPILTFMEKRRRRGLRFRRIKRAKKARSDGALREATSPTILSYVQSVQRHCLMDTTPRKCPILGCHMIFYGIINYNDHLNLCHFKDRKYICHYCHEGFETEYDKLIHENEHIGISKLGTNMSTLSSVGQTYKMASITQTEPETKIPEEKLKKIVSFFDKISDPEQILTEIKKSRSSETNLNRSEATANSTGSASERSGSEQTRATSCVNVRRDTDTLPHSEGSINLRRLAVAPHTCRFCGENFSCRRQLTLHMDSEHRTHGRFTKYHSCAGIVRTRAVEDGSINIRPRAVEGSFNVQTATESLSGAASVKRSSTTLETLTRGKSDESLTCDPSTNIVYYTSAESLDNKPSLVDSFVAKVRSYRWEPGTKIIRV